MTRDETNPRIPMLCDVRAETLAGHRQISGVARDLSSRGMFISTEDLLAVDAVVCVHVTLPHGGRVTVGGRVVRHGEAGVFDGAGFAVSFHAMEQAQRQELSSFITAVIAADTPLASDDDGTLHMPVREAAPLVSTEFVSVEEIDPICCEEFALHAANADSRARAQRRAQKSRRF